MVTHHIHVAITQRAGLYFAVALNLPGTGGSGETEEDAMENAGQAFLATIESLAEMHEDPWVTAYDIPPGVKTLWVEVNA